MKAYIFDTDGVIFDSERLYIDCSVEAAEVLGMDSVVETCRRCIGVTDEVTRAILFDIYRDEELVERFRDLSIALVRERVAAGLLDMKPGVRELLDFLQAGGCRIALASSTRTDIVEKELADAGLREYFRIVVGGDRVSRSKPNPDIFLKAAELLGEKPDNCIVIEDSFNGIRAAKAAGMTAVMVPDQLEPDEEMRNLADIILPSLTDVKKWLEQKRTDEKEISKTQAM